MTRQVRTVRGPAGFTLLEMIVAVGTVALLAVGLAAVFQSAGRTVTTGRRVSRLHHIATTIERHMRRDFESMTRDGFLVIRNWWLEDVPQSADSTVTRDRRIDELMFFVTGDFTSARMPVHPDMVARADAARIYYGHGAGFSTTNSYFDQPRVDMADLDLERLGVGPNRYASDWTLVRQATLLAQPATADQVLPDEPVFGIPPRDGRLYDSDVQIMGQPAASSVFQSLSDVFPEDADLWVDGSRIRDEGRPRLTTGLVDIATTDLSEIRAIVTTANVSPATVLQASDFANQPDGEFESRNLRQLMFMQEWMEDAFPAPWAWADPTDQPPRRLRCEPNPPDLLGQLDVGDWDAAAAYRFADQQMLSASNFVAHCTEFIVEWSFGDTVQDEDSEAFGKMIWHGAVRSEDADGDGVIGDDEYLATPYPYYAAPLMDATKQPYPVRYRLAGGGVRERLAPTLLIHGWEPTNPDAADPLTSFFGYVDPLYEDGGAARTIQPWPWPKLIRVTMTLADETDPSIEETFQFVFEVPGEPGA